MIDWIIKPFFFFSICLRVEKSYFSENEKIDGTFLDSNVSQEPSDSLENTLYTPDLGRSFIYFELPSEKSLSKVTTTSNLYRHKFHFTSLFPSRVFIPFPVKGNLQFKSLTSMPPYVPHDIMGMSEWVIDLYFRWEKFCKGGRITVHLSIWRIYKPTDKLQDSLLWILSMVCMS